MWDDLKRYLPAFPSGVLTAHDADEYPASVRTHITPDDFRQELRVDVPDDFQLQPGPASLLFHDHDALLWNQHVLLVRGTLATTSEGWIFRPLKLVPSMGYGGGMTLLRTIMNCRKTAHAYLLKRGLARPSVSWDTLKAAKRSHQRS